MTYQTPTYQSPQELRAARIARQRREQARRARRRKYMIRRAIALVILISAVALLVIGVKAAVAAITSNRDVDNFVAEDIKVPATTVEESTTSPNTLPNETTDTAPIVTEPQELTIEDLLANGVLTDKIALSYDLQLCAREAAETFGVPYKLLLAVMFRESSYNPNAANEICYGLMQIHQMNFSWLETELAKYGVTDIKNNPYDNIYAGAYMLGRLLDKYDDYHKALMAYNCGESGARRLWEQGYTSSTYSRNVLTTMNELDVAE